jgi:Fibronectin type III domain
MWKRILLIALSAVIMAGCAHVTPEHPYDDFSKKREFTFGLVSDGSLLKEKQDWAQKHLPALENSYYFANYTGEIIEHPERAISNKDYDGMKVKRDMIVYTLLDLIDMYQYKFNSDFYGGQAGFTSLGEITATGLGTAAAVATPVRVSKLLAALGSAVIGSTAIVNKNFIQDKATDLILARMEALRTATRKRIVAKLKLGVKQYPLGEALADVQEYARGGTIFAALNAIDRDNAKAQDRAEGRVPDPPTITGVTPTAGGKAAVTFTPGSDGGSTIEGYTVTAKPVTKGSAGTDSNNGSPSLIHNVTGLTPGDEYKFAVTAINANGTSAASEELKKTSK